MEFAESVRQHAKDVQKKKNKVKSEATAITSLIQPFFTLLGYDTSEPDEYIAEDRDRSSAGKRGSVDITVIKGKPIMLVEAKAPCISLKNKDFHTQLYGYFTPSQARVAMLTNGVVYWFYSDTDRPNVMDDKPFLEIDFSKELNDEHIDFLTRLRKEAFDTDEVRLAADKIKTVNAIRLAVKRELGNPSTEFVKLLTKAIYTSKRKMPQKTIDRYRGYIKDAIQEYANEKNGTEEPVPPQPPESQGERPKGRWNLESFLEQASSIGGADNAKLCEKLINAFTSMGCDMTWGNGKKYGGAIPVCAESGRYLCCLYNGDVRTVVQIFFGSKNQPMESAEYKQKFKSMLERIDGLRIKDAELGKRYSFDVKLLSDDAAFGLFMDTMAKYIEDIKAAEPKL